MAAVSILLLFSLAEIVSHAGPSTQPVKIVLPPETGSFKTGPGSALANGQCLICHSVEYVVIQPVMPRPFWLAEVKKMREKYGAVIDESQVEPLVDYLVRNYGSEMGKAGETVSSNANTGTTGTSPTIDEAMASKYGCIGCHNVNVKIVGPAFKDVVAKYRTDPAAVEKILEQIRTGSSGKWGPALMPPFPTLPEAEAKTLARWVMRQGSAQP